MSVFSDAQDLYDGCELLEIMAFCAHYGVVYADNECFFCAYPTHSSLIEIESKYVNEIKYQKGVDNTDTWYVYIASGNLKRAFEKIVPLKYVAYRRMDEKFRLIEFDRMRRLIWQTQ